VLAIQGTRTGIPAGCDPDAPPKNPEPVTEPSLFQPVLPLVSRKEMAGDQKKWNGVLIERGYFDAGGQYTLRGVRGHRGGQNDALVATVRPTSRRNRSSRTTSRLWRTSPALEVISDDRTTRARKRVTPVRHLRRYPHRIGALRPRT